MKILFPTDFSDHAKRALDYTVHLANALKAELHVITVFSLPSTATSMVAMDRTIKENRITELNELCAGVMPMITTDIPPVVSAIKGSAPLMIANYAEKKGMNLIVMGTQGNGSVANLLFGSVTRKVAKKSKVPLLAVPMEADFNELKGKNILFSLDAKQVENVDILSMPKAIAKALGAKIDILHIATKKDDFLIDPFVSKYLEAQMGEIVVRHSHLPLVEINAFLEVYEEAMIVMIRREKSFIENLFLKGFTEEEVGVTTAPLLILSDA